LETAQAGALGYEPLGFCLVARYTESLDVLQTAFPATIDHFQDMVSLPERIESWGFWPSI
jgi:hypothetical protein